MRKVVLALAAAAAMSVSTQANAVTLDVNQTLFDFTLSNIDNRDVVGGTNFDGSPFGSLKAFGYHLYYTADASYDSATDTPVLTREVGVSTNDKGIGVRDTNIGNIGNQFGPKGSKKQEVLLLEFGPGFDWTPISAQITRGLGDTIEVFVGNAVTPGSFSLLDMTSISAFIGASNNFTFDFGALIGLNQYVAFASLPYINFKDAPDQQFQVANLVGAVAVPAPAALPLLLTGLFGLGFLARRKATLTA